MCGALTEYLVDPTFLMSKLGKEDNHSVQCDLDSYLLQLALIAQTSPAMPLIINSWEHLHSYNSDCEVKTAKVQNVLTTWQTALRNLSKQVVQRNIIRKGKGGSFYPFDAFNPAILHTSVSV